jgi:hypothetical protein
MSLISILILISVVTYNCIIKSNDNNCWSHWLCLIAGIVDSNPNEGMDVHLCVFVMCCVSCALFLELITCSEESYCACVCVCVYWIVCHLETQKWDGLGPTWAVAQQKNYNILFTHVQYIFNQYGLHVSTSCYLQTLKCQYKCALQMHFMNNRGILCTYNNIKYYGMDPS